MIKKIFLITIFAGLMIAGCTPAMDLCGPSAIEVSNDIILTEEGEFDFFDVTCSTSWVMSGEIPTWMTIDCPSFPVGGMGTTSIKVTMEENNEGDPRFAVFTFLAATGDVATVTVTQLTLGTFAIVQTLTNVTSSNMAATVFKGNTFSTTFSVGSGFVLPAAITVTMGGDVLTNGHDYDYNSATGVLNVSGVTGTVQITVTGVAVYSLAVAVATGQSSYGSVDIDTGFATGNISGSTVKVIATPAPFYVFEKWVATDDIDAVAESVNAEYEFHID
ncbi:MAG: BACON domain-containing protein, partial [Prevotellaceae bacterium]|nr:BACON domain-containing protein [Prevotellaceae bacterium]